MFSSKVSQRLFSTGFRKSNVVIVGAKRTPIGSFMGQFKDMTAPHLATVAATGALYSCEVKATEVEEVYMGAVLQAGMG
jgi:acetyl-CoA C-acetyltransferase